MNFSYHKIRTERGAWNDIAKTLEDAYGVWRGEIGWYTDEGAVMATGSDITIPRVVDHAVERLEATVRPVDATPPREDGIYAHRWFHVKASDWDEFLELSEGAWPGFESTFGVRIVGLWRSLDDPERVLLITRYPSLAVWESSRPYAAETPESAQESRRRFLRRAELTQRTIVRVTRLVRPVS